MKKLSLIITLLVLCGMPLYSSATPGTTEIVDEKAVGPPITRDAPAELVQAQIFNGNGAVVYQGMAYIISGKLVVNTIGWAKGAYTAYAKATGKPDRVFTIVCE